MQDLALFLKALACISWPAFAFTALLLFKTEIGEAIGRIRKGKILGQEFELSDELKELHVLADATAAETGAAPAQIANPQSREDEEEFDGKIKEILRQTNDSPKLALIILSTELDRAVREAIAVLRGGRNLPMADALKQLEQHGFPQNMSGSIRLFRDVRNRIVHGHESAADEILQAIDSGITILKAVNALPRERNIVHHPGVDIYSDETCETKASPPAKGLILETTSPGGTTKSFRIFPTTRTYFQQGKEVSWEWNMSQVWPACWYKEPDSGEIKSAWMGSAEFVGRHLDEL